LKGEGSSPEVIDAACEVLNAIAETCDLALQIETGEIGCASAQRTGKALSEDVAHFCGRIFEAGGAIVAGAGGGRFLYDLHRRFQLYYKLNPLRSYPELRDVCRVKLPAHPINVLVVRENLQGLYQGNSIEISSRNGREIEHIFFQNEKQVQAILQVAVAAARERKNALAVISHSSGLPAIHSLWHDCALDLARASGVEVSFFDMDHAAYKLLQEPEAFDVIVAPNCFGDTLSDLGGLLAGSRGLTFGASYSANGGAVYQTNHGAAHDRAETDTANPVGQIFSMAMMLREAFGLPAAAQLLEDSVRSTWRAGWRTADLAEPGCSISGTRQFGELVAQEINRAAIREACSATG
jgi:3-isopropylmalate dehydrogenase